MRGSDILAWLAAKRYDILEMREVYLLLPEHTGNIRVKAGKAGVFIRQEVFGFGAWKFLPQMHHIAAAEKYFEVGILRQQNSIDLFEECPYTLVFLIKAMGIYKKSDLFFQSEQFKRAAALRK
jgi:hypothetical protein